MAIGASQTQLLKDTTQLELSQQIPGQAQHLSSKTACRAGPRRSELGQVQRLHEGQLVAIQIQDFQARQLVESLGRR